MVLPSVTARNTEWLTHDQSRPNALCSDDQLPRIPRIADAMPGDLSPSPTSAFICPFPETGPLLPLIEYAVLVLDEPHQVTGVEFEGFENLARDHCAVTGD